jgi:hypothetical protein
MSIADTIKLVSSLVDKGISVQALTAYFVFAQTVVGAWKTLQAALTPAGSSSPPSMLRLSDDEHKALDDLHDQIAKIIHPVAEGVKVKLTPQSQTFRQTLNDILVSLKADPKLASIIVAGLKLAFGVK